MLSDFATPLLEVRDLSVSFKTEDGLVQAVDNLSLTVTAGEVLGIVGESGSGKTVSMMAVIRLIRDPNAIVDGQVLYRGRDLMPLPKNEIAIGPRPRDRDDLPGSDDRADAGVHGRLADRGADPGAREPCRAPSRAPAPSTCSRRSGIPNPADASTSTRTSSRAECASAS